MTNTANEISEAQRKRLDEGAQRFVDSLTTEEAQALADAFAVARWAVEHREEAEQMIANFRKGN